MTLYGNRNFNLLFSFLGLKSNHSSIKSHTTTAHLATAYYGYLNNKMELTDYDLPSITCTVCLIGLVLYPVVAYCFVKYRKTDFSNPFYTLLLGLAAYDYTYLLMNGIVLVNFFGWILTPTIVNFVASTVTYFIVTQYLLLAVISVNRFISVRFFMQYNVLFSPRRTMAILTVCVVVTTLCKTLVDIKLTCAT